MRTLKALRFILIALILSSAAKSFGQNISGPSVLTMGINTPASYIFNDGYKHPSGYWTLPGNLTDYQEYTPNPSDPYDNDYIIVVGASSTGSGNIRFIETGDILGSISVNAVNCGTYYSISAGTPTLCGGATSTISLSGSELNVTYNLYKNGSFLSSVTGTGSGVGWSGMTAGSYTAVATAPGCSVNMDGTAVVTTGTVPTSYTLTAASGGGFCTGSAVPRLTLSGIQANVSYSLYLNGAYSTGNGTNDGSGHMYWDGYATGGANNYYIVGSHSSGCNATVSGTVHITENAVPAGTYNLTGNTSICAGQNTNITLGGSDPAAYNISYQLKDGSDASIGSAKSGTGSSLVWTGAYSGDYTVKATTTTGCSRTMTNTVHVNAFNSAATISTPSVEIYEDSNSGTITLSPSNNTSGSYYDAVQKWQANDGSGWRDINNTVSSIVYKNLTSTMRFRAVVIKNVCGVSANSSEFVATYYPKPVVTGNAILPAGGSSVLSVPAVYTSYQWYLGGTLISGATSNQLTATAGGTYSVVVKGSATAAAITSNSVTLISPGSVQLNSHRVTGLKAAYQTMPDLGSIPTTNYSQKFDYIDGLARTIQQVVIGQTSQQKDLVVPVAYDSKGRAVAQYLPYTDGNRTGTYRGNALIGGYSSTTSYNYSEQLAFYGSTSGLIEQSTVPFSTQTYDDSPLSLVTEQAAPGTSWQLSNHHTVRTALEVNSQSGAADIQNILKWTTAGYTAATYYSTGDLVVNKVTDENNNLVYTFTDKLGRTILKRVQLGESVDGTPTTLPFLETYYVYDDRGNLAFQIPPKASAKVNAGATWNTAFINEWCFSYMYDKRNRLVEKKAPGALPTWYAYDPLNRLVLTQDGNQRLQSKWTFIKYDGAGRAVMQGFYKNTTYTTQTAIQTNVLDPLYSSGSYYETRGTTLHGYTNVSFPTLNSDNSALEIQSVSYYDNYDFDYSGGNDQSYFVETLPGEGQPAGAFGLPTGSKRLVGTSTWLYNYVFYDKFGRAIQTLSNNHKSTTIDNRSTVVYDFEGKVTYTKNYHNVSGVNNTTTTIRNEYDAAGRLQRIYHRLGAAREVVVAYYKYNELGQVIEKNLHCTTCDDDAVQPSTVASTTITKSSFTAGENLRATQSITLSAGYFTSGGVMTARIISDNATIPSGGGSYLQSVDYRYNIRGWVKSINNAKLTDDSATAKLNDDTNDYFGMEIGYDANIGMGNGSNYNGNISAMKWKTFGQTGANTANGQRSYKYDYDKSDKLKLATFQAYDTIASTWTKEAGTLDEGITYDHNGNILSLTRKENNRGFSGTSVTSSIRTVDGLSYTYATNFGNRLTKVEDSGTTSGFSNAVTTTSEYKYDTIGNLTRDKNKGIDSIRYTELGKVKRVKFTDGRHIDYTYDAVGTKLTVKNYNASNTLIKTTDYIDGFVYEDNVLSFFSSPEGRVVKNGSNLEYQYSLTDHQGNTRILFTSAPPAPVALTAKFEGTAGDDVDQFTNVDVNKVYNSVAANHTPGGGKVIGMNQTYSVGPSKSLKVYPGDKVDMEVYGYYSSTSGYGSNSSLGAMITSIAGAFGGVSGGPGESGGIFSGVNSVMQGFGLGPNTDPTRPSAFLNYILFDQNYKPLTMGFTVIPSSPNTQNYMSLSNIKVKEAGYIFVYLSYEDQSNNFVYFDDFKVTHTKSNLIQGNEYYPFGMQTVNSWTRENTTGNNFLGNAGTELNVTSGVYDLDYRNFDPVLGRMNQIDPMVDSYSSHSPYSYSFNDPISFNDPNGADPFQDFNALLLWAGIYLNSQDGGGGGSSGNAGVTITRQGFDFLDFDKAVVAGLNYNVQAGSTGELSGDVSNANGNVYYTYETSNTSGNYNFNGDQTVGSRNLNVIVSSVVGNEPRPWNSNPYNGLKDGDPGDLGLYLMYDVGTLYEHLTYDDPNYVGGTVDLVGGPTRAAAKLAINGVRLAEQLSKEAKLAASLAQMAEKGRTIIKFPKLAEVERLVKQYGGEAIDWVKKTSSSYSKGLSQFETHWFENTATQTRVEIKTKIIK